MRYLVTGGTGFIGSHLVDRLLTNDHEVLVLDNFFAGKEENLVQHKNNSSLKIFKQSVTEDITDVFDQGKIDAVFHLAALPRLQFSIDHPIEAHNVNINGTLNLLQACRNFGIKRFILSSSSSVYGQHDKTPLVETLPPHIIVPYALQKLTSEYYCQIYYQLYGIETIILRYFSVYGPRQNPRGPYGQAVPKFFDNVIHHQPPSITGDGTQTRSPKVSLEEGLKTTYNYFLQK
ncbi:NAD-dependent epimerase/dehydratase family protein [Candidatus Gottesmanbacteria bacterium]|nr:NAD-dependent epimerase/dehydratase family protein [Candidatus Gottesmanbacteria bacterium]